MRLNTFNKKIHNQRAHKIEEAKEKLEEIKEKNRIEEEELTEKIV